MVVTAKQRRASAKAARVAELARILARNRASRANGGTGGTRPKKAKRRSAPRQGPGGMREKQASWYMNPFIHDKPPASATSIGPFALVRSVLRYARPSDTNNDMWLLMFHSDTAVKAISFIAAVGAGTQSGVVTALAAPQLVQCGLNDSSALRPLRAALKIRNTTVFTSLAGEVQIYKIPNHYDWNGEFILTAGNPIVSAPMMDQLKTTMDGSMRTRSITGAQLTQQHLVVAAPASHQGYNEWLDVGNAYGGVTYNVPAAGTWTAGDITVLTDSINNGGAHDPMEMVLIRVKQVATVQQYSFTMGWHDAVRLPEGSYGMSNAIHQPKGNQTALNMVHEAVSGSGIFNEETGAAVGGALATAGMIMAAGGRFAMAGARAIEGAGLAAPLLAIGM